MGEIEFAGEGNFSTSHNKPKRSDRQLATRQLTSPLEWQLDILDAFNDHIRFEGVVGEIFAGRYTG